MIPPGVAETWGKLGWIDFVAFIIVARTLYVGYKRGFIPELTTLIGLGISLLVSLQHAHAVSLLAAEWLHFSSEKWFEPVSILSLFVITYLVFRLIRLGISKLFHLDITSGLDRWGGALVGLLRGGFIISLCLVVLSHSPSAVMSKGIKETSISGPYLVRIVPKVYEIGLQFYPFRTPTGIDSLTSDL
ncbi:MAG: CvpA family protein [Candidatus Omnitrophica bacterium]|nr:CvpA family protein [Candidatus Omnitrophota bacterium]